MFFFSFGDLEPPLEYLNSVLSRFDKTEMKDTKRLEVDLQKSFSEPRRIIEKCPPDALIPDPERQTKLLCCWLGPEIDSEDIFGLNILSALLIDDPSAPFYKSLIEVNIKYSRSKTKSFTTFFSKLQNFCMMLLQISFV